MQQTCSRSTPKHTTAVARSSPLLLLLLLLLLVKLLLARRRYQMDSFRYIKIVFGSFRERTIALLSFDTTMALSFSCSILSLSFSVFDGLSVFSALVSQFLLELSSTSNVQFSAEYSVLASLSVLFSQF